MAFTVHGYLDGVAYSLAVADDHALDGTDRILGLLEIEQGREHSATPTGPTLALDPADPASVLAALMELTTITSVEGDPPQLFDPAPLGSVY